MIMESCSGLKVLTSGSPAKLRTKILAKVASVRYVSRYHSFFERVVGAWTRVMRHSSAYDRVISSL